MSTALGILGVFAFLAFIFFAAIAIIHKIKSKDDCKAQLKKAAICFVASIVLIGAGMAAQTPEERAANEQARLERIAKEQAEKAEKEAKEQAEKEAKEKAEAEAKEKEAQEQAEKEKAAASLTVTEQNENDKKAISEYVTNKLSSSYWLANLTVSTNTDNTYFVMLDIKNDYTVEQAQAHAKKIRRLLSDFPAPVETVNITFRNCLISYSTADDEFVQINQGQRTTFK